MPSTWLFRVHSVFIFLFFVTVRSYVDDSEEEEGDEEEIVEDPQMFADGEGDGDGDGEEGPQMFADGEVSPEDMQDSVDWSEWGQEYEDEKFAVNPVENIPHMEGEEPLDSSGMAALPGEGYSKAEVMSYGPSPRAVRLRKFVPADEFLAIRRLARNYKGQSEEGSAGRYFEMFYDGGINENYRTATDGDPPRKNDVKLVQKYIKRVDELILGKGNHNSFGGSLRIRRYITGQGHSEHVDTYNGGSGTLFVTVMLTMRAALSGGATILDYKGPNRFNVNADVGEMTVWWSCKVNGRADKSSMHVGEKVKKGVKWTATYFIYHKDRKVCNNSFWHEAWASENRSWMPLADPSLGGLGKLMGSSKEEL